MTAPLRFGLIGTGRIGRLHAANIAANADTVLTRVADPFIDGARETVAAHGGVATDSTEALFEAGDLDAVLVASPTATHVDLIARAVAAGVPVLCEKPIDLDIARVDALRETVAASGVPVALGFNRRFDPAFREVRMRVAAGEIGDLEQLTIVSRDPAPAPASYVAVSGGIFRDMTIHDFDMARFFLPDIVEVHATGSVLFDDGARAAGDHDTAVVTLRAASGAVVTIINSRHSATGGVMTGFTALVVGIVTTQWGLNIWVAAVLSLALALAIGALNGYMVMKTGLPSFIVTLGTFFILAGIYLAVTKLVTGQVAIQGMTNVPMYDTIQPLFGSSITIGGGTFYISVLWWILVTILATWVLLRTRPVNWIFAVGGQVTSARQVGVPVMRTKIGLFMTTACAAWLVGMISLFRTSTVQANTGVGQEFIYIICAVVGGCLMTGGFGSAIGAALGALIYGMVFQGITFAQWDTNWLRTVLGVMLLFAVLLNH